jgi:hypothetical protein
LPFNVLMDRADQLRKGRVTSLYTLSRVPVNISPGKVSGRPHFEGRLVEKHQRVEQHGGERRALRTSVMPRLSPEHRWMAREGINASTCVDPRQSSSTSTLHSPVDASNAAISPPIQPLAWDTISTLRQGVRSPGQRHQPLYRVREGVDQRTLMQKMWDPLAANHALGTCSKRVPCLSPVCSLATATGPLRRLCTLPLCSLVGWCHNSISNRGL